MIREERQKAEQQDEKLILPFFWDGFDENIDTHKSVILFQTTLNN